MKHRIFAFMLALCLVVCCAGCGSDAAKSTTAPSTGSAPTDPSTPPADSDPMTDPDAVALKVNGHLITAMELEYFYVDAINEFINQYSYYISYILNLSKPLSQQVNNDSTGETWADYFLNAGIESVKNTYALYDAAMASGHTLSQEETDSIETLVKNLEEYAKYYKFKSADEYLQKVYGKHANTTNYSLYYKVLITASSYYSAHAQELKESYTPVSLRDFEGDKFYQYNSYSYATVFLDIKDFEDQAAVKQAAELLANPENNSVEKLNAALEAMEKAKNPEKTTFTTATEVTNKIYTGVSALMQEWMRDSARQEGDITALPYNSTDATGKETFGGYYVVLFQGVEDNQFPLANVRHILVAFESSNGTTYSEADKQKAKDEAEKIYQEWKDGDHTEDSFAALAKKYTDDGNGDVGGIYYDIYPGQMVTTFNDWCFDESRIPGDHGIVQTEYGYHVMYYSGDSETTYRDYLVTNDKLAADMEAWQKALIDAAKLETLDTTQVNLDYIINS